MFEKTVKKFNLHTVFIYITERCNLKCTYCYLKHKRGRDIDLKTAGLFLASLRPLGTMPGRFEISGGEPLLSWDRLQELVRRIEISFPGRTIGVQTNGLLLSKERIRFINKHRISLEIGIDGDINVTTRRRKQMESAGYKRLVSNIRQCVAEGISVGCNMTVHPDDAAGLIANCLALISLGVSSIDVTPAAFMRWSSRAIDVFKDQYTELMELREVKKKVLMEEDTRFMAQPFLDLSFHPPGYVLCGDAYLCLSDRERARHSLWDPSSGKMRLPILRSFLKAYESDKKKLQRKAYTHRDYVCASFRIVNDLVGKEYLNTGEIIPLMRFLTRMHVSSR